MSVRVLEEGEEGGSLSLPSPVWLGTRPWSWLAQPHLSASIWDGPGFPSFADLWVYPWAALMHLVFILLGFSTLPSPV